MKRSSNNTSHYESTPFGRRHGLAWRVNIRNFISSSNKESDVKALPDRDLVAAVVTLVIVVRFWR
jgi:hypothetical protein